jgi:hypothetical protein
MQLTDTPTGFYVLGIALDKATATGSFTKR